MLASVNLDNGNLNSSCRHHSPRHLRLASQAEIKGLDFQSLTLIERALQYDSTHTLNDVLADLREGRAQLGLQLTTMRLRALPSLVLQNIRKQQLV